MNSRLKNQPWPRDFKEAKLFQEKWASSVDLSGEPTGIKHVAGVDLSCIRGSARAWVAVVVLHVKTLDVVEVSHAVGEMTFPYVPGYLSFREGPIMMEAIEKVTTQVDLWFFDGQGYAHPRRFGLACHLGLYLDKPSIGVAKNLFVGTHKTLGLKRGNRCALMDEDEMIGEVLRTKDRVKPVYISPGHQISIKVATDWTLRVTKKLRIPEPTRQAHMEVNRFRRSHNLQ